MPQAIANPVREAAAAIVALINANPRSPRQEDIEAIIAKAVPCAVSAAPATPLLAKIRETAARLSDAFDVHAKTCPGDPAEETVESRIDRIEAELADLEHQIPSPPQSFADLVAWAEIARAGAGIKDDGSMDEAHSSDVFERPAARLVEAVLQFAKGGRS